jgi:hypothetical protein
MSGSASAAAAAGAPHPQPHPPPLVQHAGVGLRVGDLCDCLDAVKKWCLAEVLEFDGWHLLIRCVDWNAEVHSRLHLPCLRLLSELLHGVASLMLRVRVCHVNAARRMDSGD